MDWSWLDWAAVAVLGGVVGASELISRYKDEPGAAIQSWPAIFYIAINSAASVGALGLIHAGKWFDTPRWTQILMAGVSAMAFFRLSLFVVRAGDRDVGVGPQRVPADLSCGGRPGRGSPAGCGAFRRGGEGDEGRRFREGAEGVATLLHCVALMQNVSPEDQQLLNRVLEALEKRDAEPSVKALLLGIELINVVGVDVLTTAVESIGEQIRSVPEV